MPTHLQHRFNCPPLDSLSNMANDVTAVVYGVHTLLLFMCLTLLGVGWSLETLLLLVFQAVSYTVCAVVVPQYFLGVSMHIARACYAVLALLALLYIIWIQLRFPMDSVQQCLPYEYRVLVMAAALAVLSLVLMLFQLFVLGRLHVYLKNSLPCFQSNRSSVELFTDEEHQGDLFEEQNGDGELPHRAAAGSDSDSSDS